LEPPVGFVARSAGGGAVSKFLQWVDTIVRSTAH